MELIKRIDIGYFRSIYKATLDGLGGTTVLFGRNDAGKSNVLRALNLFFNGETNPGQPFELDRDLSHARVAEMKDLTSSRRLAYVKIEFRTPTSYQPSLGKSFWVKKTWSLNAQAEPSVSDSLKGARNTYLKRLLNKISFHYVPAIKDRRIFESLLSATYQVLASDPAFRDSLRPFSEQLQSSTRDLSEGLFSNLNATSVIAPPTDLTDLFRSLDFETSNPHGDTYSLKLQRGDGIQVRHIPAILAFLADRSEQEHHIWGFEEPENSLEIAAAIAEAESFVRYGKSWNKQVFLTSHSPAFFNLRDDGVRRYFVADDEVLGRRVSSISLVGDGEGAADAGELMGETPHLAVISSYLATADREIRAQRSAAEALARQLEARDTAMVFVEGASDAIVIHAAWEAMIGGEPPFVIEPCEGTAKMSALSATGRVLGVIGSQRRIFVVADNDSEGRGLFANGHLRKGGRWVSHSNGAQWCLLHPTGEFKAAMRRVGARQADWPFTLENLFPPALRARAVAAGVYVSKKSPYKDIHEHDNSVLDRVLDLPGDDPDRYYLCPVQHDYKVPFAEWVAAEARRDASVLEPIRGVIEGLDALLREPAI